jgi:hypothetical protein
LAKEEDLKHGGSVGWHDRGEIQKAGEACCKYETLSSLRQGKAAFWLLPE